MPTHRARFERWLASLDSPARFLVDRVLGDLIPEFTARQFQWHADYAGGDAQEVAASTIPLQRRDGAEWPTVEISFGHRGRPWFAITFAVLPPVCRRIGMDIPRERAIVAYAPAYFMLCRGRRRNLDGQFGYHWFSLAPRRRLVQEVLDAKTLLPVLFDAFKHGIPREWLFHEFGYVAPHVMLLGSWHLFEERRRERSTRGGVPPEKA